MRSVFRSVLVALVAVLAFGAMAASGASAHEFYIEGKSMKEFGLKEEAISGKGITVATLSDENRVIEIVCRSSNLSGTIKEGGTGTAALALTKCTVNRPAHCSVVEPVVLETNSSLVEVEGKLADRFALLEFPYEFAFRFKNNGGTCAFATLPGEGQITGLMASEAEKETGTLKFTATSGTSFDVGGDAWFLSFSEENKLSGANAGKLWSAKK